MKPHPLVALQGYKSHFQVEQLQSYYLISDVQYTLQYIQDTKKIIVQDSSYNNSLHPPLVLA